MKQPDPGKPIVLTGGPRTEEGKAISARNATKHGCCSTETLILASEREDEFKSLKSAWFQTYQPKLEAEIHLVNQLVEADWFNQRATRTAAEVEAQLFKTTPNAAEWTEAQQKTLGRFLRYQTTRNNTLIKRQKAVEDYRKNRAAELNRESRPFQPSSFRKRRSRASALIDSSRRPDHDDFGKECRSLKGPRSTRNSAPSVAGYCCTLNMLSESDVCELFPQIAWKPVTLLLP